MLISPDTTTALAQTVTVASAHFGAAMVDKEYWLFTSSTNCWIKQADGTPTAVAAAAANMYVPANTLVVIDGRCGANIAVIRDTADGRASLTRLLTF
jgi:hypothetical protein